MGAGQSSLKVEMDASPLRQSLSGHGYHVLSVTRGSSAHAHGIEAHFDYIVAVDGVAVADTDVTLLERAVSHHSDPSYSNASSDSKVALLVWNSRSTLVRPVSVSVPMGITVRMCALRHARERVWRVLNVLSNSPAEDAGLHPSSDYIIGATEADSLNSLFPLKDRDDLFRLVESRIGSYVSLTVYSSVLQSIRVVVLSPRFDWGGPGCMGCDIGYGPHHRIPVPIQPEKSNIPNASLVEKDVRTISPLSPTLDQFGSKPLMRIVSKSLPSTAQQDSHSHSEESHSHGHGHGHGREEHVEHGHANSHRHGSESSDVEHGHGSHGSGHETGHYTHGHDSHGREHENGHGHDNETNLGHSDIHASHDTHGHGHENGHEHLHEHGNEHGHEHGHEHGNHDNHDHKHGQSVHGNDEKNRDSVHVEESEVYAAQPVSQPVTPVDAHEPVHGHGRGKNHGHGHSH